MKIIIIGGSGATGKELVKKLLLMDECSELVVLLRRKYFDEHPKLKQVIVDFEKLEKWSNEIKGDVAFSCLGTTLKIAGSKEAQWRIDYDYQYNFAQICKANGIPTFVLLSAINANSNSFSFYSKMKGALEEAVNKLQFNNLIIFQPSVLIRPDSDRIFEKLAVKLVKFINSLGVSKEYAPIDVKSLARAMINSTKVFVNKINVVKGKDIKSLA